VSDGVTFGPVRTTDDGAEIDVRVPPTFVGFDGHFPGAPVLPGMCHVDLAVRAAEKVSGRDLRLTEVARARFHRTVSPGEDLRVRVRLVDDDPGTVRVETEHRVAGELAATLSLLCAPCDAGHA